MFQYHQSLILHLTFRTRADLALMVEFLGMATAAHISDLPTKWQFETTNDFQIRAMSLEIGDTWTKRENTSIQRFLSCFFGKSQFRKIRQPSELPGVRSLMQFALRWHEARDPRGCTESPGFEQRLKGPAFWLYTEGHWRAPWKLEKNGDLWWVGRPKSETKITNFEENPKSKIRSQAWRCRISTAMNVSFVQGPGSNRHTTTTTGITTGCQEAKYQRHNLDQVGWC